jgi:hypothetical protein
MESHPDRRARATRDRWLSHRVRRHRASRPLRGPRRRSPNKETGEQAKQTVARQEAAEEVESSAETTTEEASGRLRCSKEEKKEREDLRLGDFEPPEYAPEYEIFEEQPRDLLLAVFPRRPFL